MFVTFSYVFAYIILEVIFINISKVMNFISENNIKPDELFSLVEKVKSMDLSDEVSIRKVIKDVSWSIS